MIIHRIGNLLEENAEALVNTVNCVGVMGKGIALQFKQAFPDNFAKYQKACRENKVKPGQMFVVPTGSLFNPKYIINFPTKIHWRGKSKIEYIEKGLTALVQEVKRLGIKSIAVPPLGCGNGGLEWDEVRPLIEKAFAEVPDVKVYLYLPTVQHPRGLAGQGGRGGMRQDDRAPQFDPIRLALWSQADVCRCLARGKWRWIDGWLMCVRCRKPKYPDQPSRPWWAYDE